MNVAVLMSCHNRCEMTLNCLARLLSAFDAAADCLFKVFLVDDGSTDGTADAVRKSFPSVNMIEGAGNLYWAKGMNLAWRKSIAEDDWDAYLWLNDDTVLGKDSIVRMMAADNGERIVVGELENSRGEIVYGVRKDGLFTGNCVLVPRRVYNRIGMICGEYSHAWADSDYAMQAKRAGVAVVSAGIVGQAEGHANRPSLKNKTLKERLALLRNPKGWNVHDLWLYRKRNWGLAAAVVSCIHLILHVIGGERNWIKCLPWILMCIGYFSFGIWIRGHWDVTVEKFELIGYDYADYLWFMSDWREIFYPRPRHPLFGIFFFPVALIVGWMKSLSMEMSLIVLNMFFAIVMTLCAWMVGKISRGGFVSGILYASFASSLLLGGIPESFGISALLSLLAIWWFVHGGGSNKIWLSLSFIAGGITITQGIKVLLLHYVFGVCQSIRMRVRRLFLIGMVLGVVALVICLVFLIVWWLRKTFVPGYSRTILDMIGGLATEFSYSKLTYIEILEKWWIFLSEPLVTRGIASGTTVISDAYPNTLFALMPLLLLVLSAFGMWMGRKSRIVKALLVFLSVDFFVHFLVGWGMYEPHLYAGHWTFTVPILCMTGIDFFKSVEVKKVARAVLFLYGVMILVLNLHLYGVI